MDSLNRREFVAAAGATALFTARSYSQIKGANERLRIGVIGAGGMATGHMHTLVRMREKDNLDILGVCDVYRKRLDMAAQLTGGKPYKEYRKLLEVKDIDYVLIATPEHWHAQMTLDAASAGKHIYCEKPMTHTTEEAKRVVAKIKATGVKMQVGVQGTSDDSYETAFKYVQEGVLGKVTVAEICYSRNHVKDFWDYGIDAGARPGEDLDWKAWLGPAPKRDWDPNRFFRWRWFWDYSGGIATDLFVHRVTRIIKALGLQFPDRGVATGGKFFFKDSAAEVPDVYNSLLDYPGGTTVILVSSMANDTPVKHVLRGNKATLEFTRTGFTITPQKLFEKEGRVIEHKKSGGENIEYHHRNLQNAIRKGEALRCDSMLGYYGVVAAGIGVESFRRRKYMLWDKARERLVKS
jgi:predicted dehydrogenase